MVKNILRASAYDSTTDELGDLKRTIVTSSINFYGENNIIDIQENHQQNRKGIHIPQILSLLYEIAQIPGTDKSCPLSYEPSGTDFLSPCIQVASSTFTFFLEQFHIGWIYWIMTMMSIGSRSYGKGSGR